MISLALSQVGIVWLIIGSLFVATGLGSWLCCSAKSCTFPTKFVFTGLGQGGFGVTLLAVSFLV